MKWLLKVQKWESKKNGSYHNALEVSLAVIADNIRDTAGTDTVDEVVNIVHSEHLSLAVFKILVEQTIDFDDATKKSKKNKRKCNCTSQFRKDSFCSRVEYCS